MGRRARRISIQNGEIKSVETPAESPAADANQNETVSQPSHPEIFETNRRVAFTVDEDGRIDLSRLQDKTKIQLREIFSKSSELEKLGISAPVARELSEIGFGEDEANAILNFITTIDAPIASRMYQVPKDICVEAFTFDDFHRRKLNPPMIRLLNKWGPSVLKTWKDEVGFALIMFSTLSAQVTAMNFLHEKRKRELPDNVTPITQNRAAAAAPPPSISPEPEQISTMNEPGKGLKGIKTDPFIARDANDELLEASGLSI